MHPNYNKLLTCKKLFLAKGKGHLDNYFMQRLGWFSYAT